MPQYEYECPEHGIFTDLRKVGERDKRAECPICGKQSIRVLSVFGHKITGVVVVPQDLDMAVGKSAEEGWKRFHERKEAREKAKENKG